MLRVRARQCGRQLQRRRQYRVPVRLARTMRLAQIRAQPATILMLVHGNAIARNTARACDQCVRLQEHGFGDQQQCVRQQRSGLGRAERGVRRSTLLPATTARDGVSNSAWRQYHLRPRRTDQRGWDKIAAMGYSNYARRRTRTRWASTTRPRAWDRAHSAQTTSSGSDANAFGFGNIASGKGSFAVGTGSVATSKGSVAIGGWLDGTTMACSMRPRWRARPVRLGGAGAGASSGFERRRDRRRRRSRRRIPWHWGWIDRKRQYGVGGQRGQRAADRERRWRSMALMR